MIAIFGSTFPTSCGTARPVSSDCGGEIRVAQALDTEVTSHIWEAAKPTTVINGFCNQRFVHFAFYGTLEAGKQFDGGFELCGDERRQIRILHLPVIQLR